MIGRIKGILGHIGPSEVDKQGKLHVGTTLLDVAEQIAGLPDGVTEIEIPINSPGGFVDIGDSIYDYLLSLKKEGKKIKTIQAGLVGSIATKIFLAGDERVVDDRYEFFIHNPFAQDVVGDADDLKLAANELDKTEKELRKFYGQFAKINDNGLDALMKQETGLTADQCLKFGFATSKSQMPVFNIVKPKNKKVDKSVKDQILALLGVKPEVKKKGVQPKAAIPGAPVEQKSLVVNLAEGAGSFWVEGDAVAVGAPCFLLDANGEPTSEPMADGAYALEDGSTVQVTGGKLANVVPAETPEEEVTEAQIAQEAANAEVVYTKDALDAIVKEEVEKALAEVKGEIFALKKGAKLGVQPRKAVIQANVAEQPKKLSIAASVAEIGKKKEEQRKLR